MNLVNRAMTGLFDVVMTPFELLGVELALVLVSGLVGIVCLIIFKYISWQAGIKGVKNKIKGNMIAIRIYQDDLWIVFKSVTSVFLRNFQYLGLNFGPILPLLIPFVLVLSQFVVRYAYDPIEVVPEDQVEELLSGQGTMLQVELKREHAHRASELAFVLPEGVRAITPIVRAPSDGLAFVEVVAVEPVQSEIQIELAGEVIAQKDFVAGDEPTRRMQPRRVSSFWASWLLPAEDAFGADSPVATIEFKYPDRDFAYLPGGEIGIVLVFFVASILFGVLVLKPLKIQI
jgi:hypothetical protein